MPQNMKCVIMCHHIGQQFSTNSMMKFFLNVFYYNSSHGIMNMKKHIANEHGVVSY